MLEDVTGQGPTHGPLELVQPHTLAAARPVRAIAMVGGTCAGKSTLAQALATSERLRGRCTISGRVTTRPPRADDRHDEVLSVDLATFRQLQRDGAFALSWQRPVPGHDPIWYGCRPVQTPVAVHLAGHGLYTNSTSVHPPDALTRAVLVGVLAPVETRRARLVQRSPEIVAQGMAEALLSHDDDAMRAHASVLVHNYGGHEPHTAAALVAFVASLVDA